MSSPRLTQSPSTHATALWYVDRGRLALRTEQLPPTNQDTARIATLYSAISRGTERLIYLGAVPETEHTRMRAPLQIGDFPFPVKYGYCAVGVVEEGPKQLQGHVAFCLQPHQDNFVAPAATCIRVPQGIPPKRATLAANMETALNGHWDASTKPGDRVIVIGGGIVGLLTAYLAAQIPGAEVTLVDTSEQRRAVATELGIAFAKPAEIDHEADVVFHTSATASGMQSAIDAAGFEATVVEMSWYGAREIGLSLGGAFHSKRLRLISSQVGHVGGNQRPRWSFRRRLAKALELCTDARLDVLVTAEIPFNEAPEALPGVFADQSSNLPPVLRYPAADTYRPD